MQAVLEGQFIKGEEKKSTKGKDYRIISIGNKESFEKLDLFVKPGVELPALKYGQEMKALIDISQEGFKVRTTFIGLVK